MAAPLPSNEAERLRTLRSLWLLDTDREPGFDVLAHAAQKAAGADIALVCLVDEDRQWFKATVGLDTRETPRAHAFCAHAILANQTFCVDDATADERFRDNPLVEGDPGIRAYVGAPIVVDGHSVGTVCAISTRPQTFPDHVRRDLEHIAAAAAERMVIGRQVHIQSRLLQTAGDAVVLADATGRITFWNRAAESLFGYSADEAAELRVADLVPLRLRPQHEAGMARVAAGGVSKLEGKPVELPGLHREGHEIPVELTLSLWNEGTERGYGAFLRDCRERKALEEARAFSDATDRFLANMSHEIRTPLNGLLGLAQALQGMQLDASQAEVVRLMRQSGKALQRMLSDVLDSARMREGALTIVNEPFDLAGLLRDVFALHAPNAREKGLTYEAQIPVGKNWVSSDPTRLTQILSNLLTNAIKFTSAGSVRLVAQENTANCWRIEVQDTGIGFSPAAAAQIFERFRQEDDTITRRFGGSGLGLSIAKEFARALGGDIKGISPPTGGAIFSLSLPLRVCTAPRAADSTRSGQEPAAKLKVLLAEDHAVNRKVVELLLEPTGAGLTMVENGALAVDAFERDRFDIVFMDMQMPVMDGLTAIAAIRKLEHTRGLAPVRIVTLSANAFEEHGQAARAAGADAHLTKPIVASALLETLCLPGSSVTPRAAEKEQAA